jgi:hypothetical protein
VCLVGDDQQLGAIGAGGILADLDAVHGAVRLTQPPPLSTSATENPTPSISTRLVTGSGSVTRWSAYRCQREGILRAATQYNLCRPYATCAKHPQLRDEFGTSHDHNSVGGHS